MSRHPLSPLYQFDEHAQVWHRPDFASISYSDGDAVEDRIAAIVEQASDVSVLSAELAAQCTDWPSLYHLSGSRANILRPFADELKHATILEIGSGCGAITRYLGETGAHVLALEGSLRRATIARTRCRDLDNVTVVAEKFEHFESQSLFDVVTLIGVLEYAPVFSPSLNPILTLLHKVRELLKPEGKLILAIENKLGLKYFAGAPEDHLACPMYGIEDRYKANEPRTLGMIELKKTLASAGFSEIAFLAPFPDYKVATSILSERGLTCPDFDAASIIQQTVRKDPQLPRMLAFSAEKIWPSLVKNELSMSLSNSFLVYASVDKQPQPTHAQVLAWHYSTRRAPEFCKETVFRVEDPNKTITIHTARLSNSPFFRQKEPMVEWTLPQPSTYQHGRLLSECIAEVFSQDDWRIEDLTPHYNQFREILCETATKLGANTPINSLKSALPGSLFDLIPQNILVDETGKNHVFDQEWQLNDTVEFGWMMVRSTLYILQGIVRIGRCADATVETPADLLKVACQSLEMTLSKEQLENYIRRELIVQMEISGRYAGPILPITSIIEGPLPKQTLSQCLDTTKAQVKSLNESLAGKTAEAANLNLQITALHRSLSWRITRPLRVIFQLGLSVFSVVGTCRRACRQYGAWNSVVRVCKALRHEGVQAIVHQIKMPPPISVAPESRQTSSRGTLSRIASDTPLGMQVFPKSLNPYASNTNEERCRQILHPEVCKLDHASRPGLSVMILNLNHPDYIIPLCNQLLKEKEIFAAEGLAFEILIGDTGTTDRSVLAYYEANRNGIRLFRELKYHFSKNNNLLAREAQCKTFLFLNNDIVLPSRDTTSAAESPLLAMYRELNDRPQLGIVGAYLYFKDMSIQHAGIDFIRDPALRGFCYHPRIRQNIDSDRWPHFANVPSVTGACLMTKASIFEPCAGLSESYEAECQDVDLCLRTQRAGFSVGIVNAGPIIHLENGTRPKMDENWPDRQRFMRRWGSFIEAKFL